MSIFKKISILVMATGTISFVIGVIFFFVGAAFEIGQAPKWIYIISLYGFVIGLIVIFIGFVSLIFATIRDKK